MGSAHSTEAATAAEARRLVYSLCPPPSSQLTHVGWARRFAAPAARTAAWTVLVAQYLLAYGSIGHILHVLIAHPSDASGALLLLAPLVILLTWALRAAVVLAAGRSPAEWEARWVVPAEAAAVVAAAAATAADPPPPAAVVLTVAMDRGREPVDAAATSVWRLALPTVRVGGGGLALGWPSVLPQATAAAITPRRPPSGAVAAASRPPRPPLRAPPSEITPSMPLTGPPREVAYGATGLLLEESAGRSLGRSPGSFATAPPLTSPVTTTAMAAVLRWFRRTQSGSESSPSPIPIRLVLRHRLRWADDLTAAAATDAVSAGLAASARWAGQPRNYRQHRAVSLNVDPALSDDEYLLVEPAGLPGRHPGVARWALGPVAYLTAEATLIPWAYWIATELLSRRVVVVVDHVLVRVASGGRDPDDGQVGASAADSRA
ncbi:hypothetical protein MMPV_000615 [Pyropia vietnamensis]